MTLRRRSSSVSVTSPCRLGSTSAAIKTESRNTSWLNDFTIEGTIGRGKFAVVKKCIEKSTGRKFAAKCIRKRRHNRDCTPDIFHEIAVLEMSAKQPYLIDLYRVYETSTEVVLILEYAAGGEIFDHCVGVKDTFTEAMSRRLLLQILEGVVFLHDNDIVHLDLKPQNILLTKEGTDPDANIKLVDFGLSKYITNGLEIREIVGTPDYVAPEVLNYEPISTATDIWSLGVVSYVMLTGVSPFLGDTKQETLMNVTTATLEFPSDLFEKLSPTCQDLIHRMLQRDPCDRLTAKDSLSHPWISGITFPCAPLRIKDAEIYASSDEEVFTSNVGKSTNDSSTVSASDTNNNNKESRSSGAENESTTDSDATEISVAEYKDSNTDLNGNMENGLKSADIAETNVCTDYSGLKTNQEGVVDETGDMSEIDVNGNIVDSASGGIGVKSGAEAKNESNEFRFDFLGQEKLRLSSEGEFMHIPGTCVTGTYFAGVVHQTPIASHADVTPSVGSESEISTGCLPPACCVPMCPRLVGNCMPTITVHPRPRRESNKENLDAETTQHNPIVAKVQADMEPKDPTSPRLTRLTLSPCTNSPNPQSGALGADAAQTVEGHLGLSERKPDIPPAPVPTFKPFSLTVHVQPSFPLLEGQGAGFKVQPHKDSASMIHGSDPSLKRRKFDYCKPVDQISTEIPVVD